MVARPCIKGALITRLVEDTLEFVEGSGADRERLEAQLSAQTRALIETKIELGSWYPIECYGEITNLLWKEIGKGDPDYLRQRGADAMKRMMEAGLYQQLNYLQSNKDLQDASLRRGLTRADMMRSTRLVGSVTGAILNFSHQTWGWDPSDPDIMLHHIHEAEAVPEAMRYVNEGAETFLIRIGRPDAPPVVSRRPTPNHIVMRYDYHGVFDS